MAPAAAVPYTPADHSAPYLLLPEAVYAFIDLENLTNIHRYLRESELEEDQVLAAWILETYLYEPTDESYRTIRTTEGFSKLDRAYRRVRSLTNKAQDKWPFFDKNWKAMSSATVRNNARGEAAPGVLYPDTEGRAARLIENHQAPSASPAPAPALEVPFGTRAAQRGVQRQKEHPRPAQQTPVPTPAKRPSQKEIPPATNMPTNPSRQRELDEQTPLTSTVSLDLSNHADSLPNDGNESSRPSEIGMQRGTLPNIVPALPSEQLRYPPNKRNGKFDDAIVSLGQEAAVKKSGNRDKAVLAQDSSEKTPNLEPDSNSEAGLDAAQDAAEARARGPDGRYVPRDKPSPVPAGASRTAGSTRRKSNRTSKVHETREPAPVQKEAKSSNADHDEGVFAAVQSPPASENEERGGHEHSTIDIPVMPDAAVSMPNDDIQAVGTRTSTASQDERHVHFSDTPSPDSALARLLAAESEAIESNLDRLPPNSRRRLGKRKSEPLSQPGPRKRGRPRNSEPNTVLARDEGSDEVQQMHDPVQTGISVTQEVEEIPRMTTRRSARHAAAATLPSEVPAISLSTSKTPKKTRKDMSGDAQEDLPIESADPVEDMAKDNSVNDVKMSDYPAEEATTGQGLTSNPQTEANKESTPDTTTHGRSPAQRRNLRTSGRKHKLASNNNVVERTDDQLIIDLMQEARQKLDSAVDKASAATPSPPNTPTPSSPLKDMGRPAKKPSLSPPASPPSRQALVSDASLIALGLSKTNSPAPQTPQPSHPAAPAAKSPSKITVNGPAHRADPTPTTTQPNSTTNTSTSISTTTNASSTTHHHQPGLVSFSAQVHTFTGIVEIHLRPADVNEDEMKMIGKYAEWHAQEGSEAIPYEQFRRIFAFARRG